MGVSDPKKQFVITRTPLRVSFLGGGTDLKGYYERDYGCVLSTAINRYIYVTVKKHGLLFNENYRLNYSESEMVNSVDEIKNVIARECLKLVPVDAPLYISTVADLPAFSGLGSSSAFAVGLLNALHTMRGDSVSKAQLAEQACHVEIEVLKRPIGKQDQYAAAIGGLNYIRFQRDGRVLIEPQLFHNQESLRMLFSNIMMFWTATQRDAGQVLAEQKSSIGDKMRELDAMRAQAEQTRDLVHDGFDLRKFANILHEGWMLKRTLSKKITSSDLDVAYQKAMQAGAWGGKLCGAGGGGFLLFVVPPENQAAVKHSLSHMEVLTPDYDTQGSIVMLSENLSR